jgi:hypothetical protein
MEIVLDTHTIEHFRQVGIVSVQDRSQQSRGVFCRSVLCARSFDLLIKRFSKSNRAQCTLLQLRSFDFEQLVKFIREQGSLLRPPDKLIP